MAYLHPLLARLGVRLPLIQAPMAGVSSPAMAAAVSRAGALGSLGLGASTAAAARTAIAEARAGGCDALNVNVFCHQPAVADPARERAWLDALQPHFARFDAMPPTTLHEIYRSFTTDEAMLGLLVELRPTAVSFHFGLPSPLALAALREAGCVLMAAATTPAEGRAIQDAGLDAVIAQGWEAGGHRGAFDPDAADSRLGTLALSRQLVRELTIPVIAAGGIMDGAGIAAVLALGAAAAQLGTAFVLCDESLADDGYRAAMGSAAAQRTVMTRAISGRPARCLANDFTAIGETIDAISVPAYPIAYDAGKALHAAAKKAGAQGYGAQWAGQGAPLARAMGAAAMVASLERELGEAQAR